MPKRKLTELIKDQQALGRDSLSADVEMTMKALDFLKEYHGSNPILRSLASRAKRIPNWVPTDRQVVQVHRIVHQERVRGPRIDSLGHRLRAEEGPRLPDSLEEPDWLDD